MKRPRGLFVSAFAGVLVASVAVIAYNLYGELTLTVIPPGRMSVLTFIGLKDLQRGTFSADALKPTALLAYAVASAGVHDFTATKGAALLSLAALPFAGGLFAFFSTRSKLVGGAAAILLSVVPFSYLPAQGGDYALVAALALVQFTALFSLLSARASRLPPAALWVVLASVSAGFAGLTLASAAWLLLLTSVSWAAWCLLTKQTARSAFVLIPGVAALASNLLLAPADPGEALRLISSIADLSSYQLLLGILGVAGAAGAVSLAYRLRKDSAPPLAMAASGLVLVPIFGTEAFILAYPVMVLLAMQSLLEARGIVNAVKDAATPDGPVTLEVQFEKAAAVAFALIMLSSPLVVGFGPGTAVQGTNYLGREELQTISQVQALNPSLFGSGLVAAPSSIAPWLRAELGVNALLALTPNESAVADAITSTSFRLRNSYLMMDDWTPFNSVRSPFIYAYDGAVYGAVLHLDDGANTVFFQSGGTGDLGGMYLTGHSFSQNGTEMALTMQLTALGLNVTKELDLAASSPSLVVSYTVSPNEGGGALANMTLPVYIEGQQTISAKVAGDSIRLAMSSADLTVTFPGGSAPTLVRGAPQDHVESTFKAEGGVIHASVAITFRSAKNSGEGPFYASLLDSLKSQGVTSLLTFAPEPGLNFLGSASGEQMAVDVKDSFNTVLYAANGTSHVESAASSTVLSQSVSNSTCDATFNYETQGLEMQKTVSGTDDSVSLTYSLSPRSSGTTLERMNVTLWIPSGRALLGYSASGDSLILRLGGGNVTITATPGLTSVVVGPDPVYGQLRALMTFSLNPSSDRAGATMRFGSAVSCKEVLASRPVISGTDEVQLFTQSAPFLQVFSDEFFTIYQVSQPELPP